MKKILMPYETREEGLRALAIARAFSAVPAADPILLPLGTDALSLKTIRQFTEAAVETFPDWKSPTIFEENLYAQKILTQHRPALLILPSSRACFFAIAYQAFSRAIPIALLDSGKRSGTLSPAETHRRLHSSLATLHFTFTQEAFGNLLSENIAIEKIFPAEDPALALLREYATKIAHSSPRAQRKRSFLLVCANPLKRWTPHTLAAFVEERPDITIEELSPLTASLREEIAACSEAEAIVTDSLAIQSVARAFSIPILSLEEEVTQSEVISETEVFLAPRSEKELRERLLWLSETRTGQKLRRHPKTSSGAEDIVPILAAQLAALSNVFQGSNVATRRNPGALRIEKLPYPFHLKSH